MAFAENGYDPPFSETGKVRFQGASRMSEFRCALDRTRSIVDVRAIASA